MTAKKNDKEISDKRSDNENKEKTCFVIMPIADHPDYSVGHFDRVYNHLIKPACEKAGFKAIRADDEKSSNMIMFDILKKIVECDMAICDLSSKNANVFYELGLRQAFNKKTVLITDDITNTPFDISGFRYIKYSESLRIDSVLHETKELVAMLTSTENAKDDEVNSIVNLLKIQPAEVSKIHLNQQESVLYDLVKAIDSKFSSLLPTLSPSQAVKMSGSHTHTFSSSSRGTVLGNGVGICSGMSFTDVEEKYQSLLNKTSFRHGNDKLGIFTGYDSDGNMHFSNGDSQFLVPNTSVERKKIIAL